MSNHFLRLFAAWVNADPATDFAAGVLFGLLNTFAAVDATFGNVCSLDFFAVDMKASLGWVGNFVWPNGKRLSDAPGKLAKRGVADGVG